jgi:hypothetical protein
MPYSRRFVVAMLACCIAGSAALVAQASARQSFQETYHLELTLVHEDFCDVEGLTVSDEVVIDGKVRAVQRGPDGPEYFLDKVKEVGLVTNLANGKFTPYVVTGVNKDLKVTENADGTVTILALFTGNHVLYDSDGKAIARNPGQSRFEFVIDLGGTPDDFSDDELISERRVKGSTGRSDDLCAVGVEALT